MALLQLLLFLIFCIIKSYERHYQFYKLFRSIEINNRWSFFFFFTEVTNLYTRWQCRLNFVATETEFNFHQSKKRMFLSSLSFCRKAASLFRGTLCVMRLTDIPLCIWLCSFRVSRWVDKKKTHHEKKCTVFGGIDWRDDCDTPDTFFPFSLFFLVTKDQTTVLLFYFTNGL